MKLQWNLQQLGYVTLVVALLIPYLVSWMPKRVEQFKHFSIEDSDLIAWIQEIDPSVESRGGNGSSSGSFGYSGGKANGDVVSEKEYTYEMKAATPNDVFFHLARRIREKIEADGWRISNSGSLGGLYSVVFSHGSTCYRVYVIDLPPSRDRIIFTEEKAVQIKIVTIGYFAG